LRELKDLVATLRDPQRAYFRELFKNIPPVTEQMMRELSPPQGQTLVYSHDAATSVYFLLDGQVKAQNEHYSGTLYAFADFSAPSLFGEFEAFGSWPYYRATLTCVSACAFLVLPGAAFLDWMHRDPEALFLRTVAITKSLLVQASDERKFLFLPANSRLLLYLINMYEKEQQQGIFRIGKTRQEMADETGFCTKTVQRCLDRLRAEGLVSLRRGKVEIDAAHYTRLVTLFAEEGEGADE